MIVSSLIVKTELGVYMLSPMLSKYIPIYADFVEYYPEVERRQI